MILGLRSKTIELLPHDPEWEKAFFEEKQKIVKLIGDKIIGIEHIGSTAIKTIHAKPIIDIAISLEKYSDGFECIESLNSIGYLYKGEYGVLGRHFFRTNDEIVKFHLHMFEITSNEWKNHILFRNYLNQNPGKAKEYEALKFKLLKEFPDERELYTRNKGPFIQKIIEEAQRGKS